MSVVAGFYPVELQDALKAPVLNPLMALGWDAWKVVRETTQKLLLVNSDLDKNQELKSRSVFDMMDYGVEPEIEILFFI